MDNVLKLVWVGEEYFKKSGTALGTLYTEDGFRSDWGKVNVHLRAGGTIEIRQPTAHELGVLNNQLAMILKKSQEVAD